MPDAPQTVFARRMREVRRNLGMTQVELARRLSGLTTTSVDGPAVTRIEKGQRVVRLDEAVYIAQVLQVPLTSLLEDAEPGEDSRLAELRYELAQARWQLEAAEEEAAQRRDTVESIERAVAELER